MSSSKFYTIFNIFNILLIAFILGCISVVCDLVSDISQNANIMLLLGLLLQITYIIVKLYLPNLLVNLAKKHTKSIISEYIQFIKNTPQNKKKILRIAFLYDIPVLLYSIYLYINYDLASAIFFITFSYIIIYAGGIFLFYLMLYKALKNI